MNEKEIKLIKRTDEERMQYLEDKAYEYLLKIAKLGRHNKTMREALEFYAEDENYLDSVEGDGERWIASEISIDNGKRAKQALKEVEECPKL